MRRELFFFLSFLLFLFPSFLQAQNEAAIMRTQFLPQNFYVGDQVEIRLLIRVPNAYDVMEPGRILQPEWGQINDIRVSSEENQVELRMRFTSFIPGIIIFPSIQLGVVQLSGISAYVNSILEEDRRELTGLQPQLLLPFTHFFIFLFFAGAVLIPLMLLLLKSPLRLLYMYFRKMYHIRKPYRVFTTNMRLLRQQIRNMQEKQFYIDLSNYMRMFLSSEVSQKCFSATTQELPSIITQAGMDKMLALRTAELFRQCDYIKFAEQHVETSLWEKHFQQAEYIAADIYKAVEAENRDNG